MQTASHTHYYVPGFLLYWVLFGSKALPAPVVDWALTASCLLPGPVAARSRLREEGVHGAGWPCPVHRLRQCQRGPGCRRGHGLQI